MEAGPQRGITAWVDRFSAIPGLLITSIACYTLLVLHVSGFRGSEGLLAWTQQNKTNVTIGVQVISHILGLIHVQVICALYRASFVLALKTRSFPIYQAQFVNAATTPRMTWDLPWKLLVLLSLVVLSSFVPAAVWAGALAPLPSDRNTIQALSIPTFDIANLTQLWDYDVSDRIAGGQWMDPKGGLISADPAATKGLMSASASDASVMTDGVHKHAKLDKTGYSYLNRSYGVGSIAGYHRFADVKSPKGFSYNEEGLYSEVSCFYNLSTAMAIYRVDLPNAPMQVYQTTGYLATGDRAGYNTYIAWMDQDIFAWATSYSEANKTVIVEMMTGATEKDDPWGFKQLESIQCNINFERRPFSVFVNTTSKSITAELSNDKVQGWPAYGDNITTTVTNWIGALTFLDSGCGGGCQMGKSVVANVQQLQNLTKSTDASTTLKAVENYMESLTDNILVNLRLLRLVAHAPQPTEEITATISVPAVIFGEFKFIIAIVAINGAITIAYLFQLLRTQAWAGIPDIDITNICDVLISAWKGGIHFSDHPTGQILHEDAPFDEDTKMSLGYHHELASDKVMLVPLLDNVQSTLTYSPSVITESKTAAFVAQDNISEEQAFLVKRKPLFNANSGLVT